MNFNDLYRKAYDGDGSAETGLFRHLAVMFRMFVRRRGIGTEDIEDIVQNALAKLARSYRRGGMKTNFAAWAQTVIKNEFIDFCRARSLRRNKLGELATHYRVPSSPRPDSDLKMRLMRCLRRLHEANPLHARIVNLNYQGFSPDEVCVRLNVTPNHRRVALCRARAMLRACLEEGDGRNE